MGCTSARPTAAASGLPLPLTVESPINIKSSSVKSFSSELEHVKQIPPYIPPPAATTINGSATSPPKANKSSDSSSRSTPKDDILAPVVASQPAVTKPIIKDANNNKTPNNNNEKKKVLFDNGREERSDSGSFRERFGAIQNPEETGFTVDDLYVVDRNERLGRGHYASVYAARHRVSGQRVAVKMIEKRISKQDRLSLEIQAMRRAGGHPNIVQLMDVFETDHHVILVLELVEGGELFEHLVEHGQYTESDAAKHIRDIVSAVDFLHKSGIVHRDLKPENVLLTSKNSAEAKIKIADFGLAKLLTHTMTTVCGTWAYAAPEVKSQVYDSKCDIWSVGVITFILLSAYHPFDPQGNSSDDEIWQKIVQGAYDFNDPVWKGTSLASRDFISKCLMRNSEERMSAEEAMNHPWLSPEAPEIIRPLPRPRLELFQKSRIVLNPLQKAAAAMRARLSSKQAVKKIPEDLLKQVKEAGGNKNKNNVVVEEKKDRCTEGSNSDEGEQQTQEQQQSLEQTTEVDGRDHEENGQKVESSESSDRTRFSDEYDESEKKQEEKERL